MARLSPQESIFYKLLAERPGQPVLAVDLLNASNSDGDNAVAKVVIHRIRRKLGLNIVARRAGRWGSGSGGAYVLEGDRHGK